MRAVPQFEELKATYTRKSRGIQDAQCATLSHVREQLRGVRWTTTDRKPGSSCLIRRRCWWPDCSRWRACVGC